MGNHIHQLIILKVFVIETSCLQFRNSKVDILPNKLCKVCFFCGSFMFLFCLMFAMSLCASVYMCFVVTCWERADLLALVCGV